MVCISIILHFADSFDGLKNSIHHLCRFWSDQWDAMEFKWLLLWQHPIYEKCKWNRIHQKANQTTQSLSNYDALSLQWRKISSTALRAGHCFLHKRENKNFAREKNKTIRQISFFFVCVAHYKIEIKLSDSPLELCSRICLHGVSSHISGKTWIMCEKCK